MATKTELGLDQRREDFKFLDAAVDRTERAIRKARERLALWKRLRDQQGICATCCGDGFLKASSSEEEPPVCEDCGGSGEVK